MNIADAGQAIGMIAEYGECEKAIERIQIICKEVSYGRSVKVSVFGREFSFCPRKDQAFITTLLFTLRQRKAEISTCLSEIGVDTTPRAPAAKETA